MSHKEVNGKLMLSIYVRPELVTVLSNEDADAKEARTPSTLFPGHNRGQGREAGAFHGINQFSGD